MSDRNPDDKAAKGATRPVMVRSKLIRRLAAAHPSIDQRDIAEAVEFFFAEIVAGLARGDRVELRGFGTFTPKKRRARRARNPSTGAAVEVGERNYLVFHAGKQLRTRLNPAPD
jgi:integration host factor subunit beta